MLRKHGWRDRFVTEDIGGKLYKALSVFLRIIGDAAHESCRFLSHLIPGFDTSILTCDGAFFLDAKVTKSLKRGKGRQVIHSANKDATQFANSNEFRSEEHT